MLEKWLRQDFITLDVPAENREQAIRLCAQPMLEAHIFTPSYIESILTGLTEFGPYIVLTPHIALAHAPAESGALKSAIGIGVLREPIPFGHSSNDPVHFVFTLSAVDADDHMSAMSELCCLLCDKEFLTLLKQAKTPQKIMNYIQNAVNVRA